MAPSGSLLQPLEGVPARRLLVAIVRRAVLDFALYKNADPKLDKVHHQIAVDAAGWLFFDGTETYDEEGRYTFLYICALLELEPRPIRAKALELDSTDIHRFSGSTGDG